MWMFVLYINGQALVAEPNMTYQECELAIEQGGIVGAAALLKIPAPSALAEVECVEQSFDAKPHHKRNKK